MGYEILLSVDFIKSYEEILGYMTEKLDNPAAAKAFGNNVKRTFGLMSIFPYGFKEKENRPGTRYALIGNYILFFSVDDTEMTVTCKDIVYAKRLL